VSGRETAIYNKLGLNWQGGVKTTGYNNLITVDVRRHNKAPKNARVHLTKPLNGQEDNTQIDLANMQEIKKHLTAGLHLTVEEYSRDDPRNPRLFYNPANNSWEMNWGSTNKNYPIIKDSALDIQKRLQDQGDSCLNDWESQIKQWADAGGS
jgi:hypothetical protein